LSSSPNGPWLGPKSCAIAEVELAPTGSKWVATAANCGVVIPGVVPPGPARPNQISTRGGRPVLPFRSKRPASGGLEANGWLRTQRVDSARGLERAQVKLYRAADCSASTLLPPRREMDGHVPRLG
jgi:hypothetical protein